MAHLHAPERLRPGLDSSGLATDVIPSLSSNCEDRSGSFPRSYPPPIGSVLQNERKAFFQNNFRLENVDYEGSRPRSGIDRLRTPVADAIALAIAGAIVTIGASPPPADGKSGRLIRTTSSLGRSPNRGTR